MNADMPIGKMADQFGITTQTVRNWVKRSELSEFFSAGAKGTSHRASVFNESDQQVVSSIWMLLQSGSDWLDIAATLKTGWREKQLPERAAVVASSNQAAVQLASRALSAEDRLVLLFERLDKQDKTINELRDKLIDAERHHSQEVERIMRELVTVQSEKAAAERELELIRQGWRPPGQG